MARRTPVAYGNYAKSKCPYAEIINQSGVYYAYCHCEENPYAIGPGGQKMNYDGGDNSRKGTRCLGRNLKGVGTFRSCPYYKKAKRSGKRSSRKWDGINYVESGSNFLSKLAIFIIVELLCLYIAKQCFTSSIEGSNYAGGFFALAAVFFFIRAFKR